MNSRLIISLIFALTSIQLFSQKTNNNTHLQKVISFNEELFFGQTDSEKWGLCHNDSSFVIKAEFDTIYPLFRVGFNPETYDLTYRKTDFIIAEKDKKYILFSLEGNQIISVEGIMPRLMKNNIVLVKNNNYWGLIKTNGEIILPVEASDPEWYDDMLSLKMNNKIILFDAQSGTLIKESDLLEIQ
jgi:hypothetical protein